jgi:hypothetical protein
MTSSFTNVLTSEELEYLNQLPEVLEAKAKLDAYTTSGRVYFTITLTDAIRNTLSERLGLDCTRISTIPMRWIKGDTEPHVDVGASSFENTYLVYMNDSAGEFLIGDTTYPISANTGYVFNEGLSHYTQNTGSTPRLLLGPMNEFAQPVGGLTTFYYPSEADALASTNLLAQYGDYTILAVSGYTHWRIASNSTGSSPQNVTYYVGNVLAGTGSEFYYLYPTSPCFLEGSKILCQIDGVDTYVSIEEIKPGTLVKTSRDGYKKVVLIGKGELKNPGNDERIENRLYKCSPCKYPELTDDLYITGCHSILVDSITDEQREKTIKQLGRIFVTDKKYRLMACIDERAEAWTSEGTYPIWHLALEHTDIYMNYGVYANGGLLVETTSIHFIKNKSNMIIYN